VSTAWILLAIAYMALAFALGMVYGALIERFGILGG